MSQSDEGGRRLTDQLWNEYALVLGIYEGFNDQVLVLKGWSVTVGIAALIAAYKTGAVVASRVVVFIATASAVPFWLLETQWKLYQSAYLARLQVIESCQVQMAQACRPGQAIATWQDSFGGYGFAEWIGTFTKWGVMLPHLALLLLGIGLLVVVKPSSTR